MSITRTEGTSGRPTDIATEPVDASHEHVFYPHADPRWLVCDCGQYAVRARTRTGESCVRPIEPPRPALAPMTAALAIKPDPPASRARHGSIPAPPNDGAGAGSLARPHVRPSLGPTSPVPTQERCRSLVGRSADFAIEVDPRMTITWVSASLTDVLGWRGDQWVGTPAASWFPDDEPGQSWQLLARVLHGDIVSGRRRVRTSAGTAVWVDRSANPLRDWTGEVIAIVTGFHLLATVDPRPSIEPAEDDAGPSRLVGLTAPELRLRAAATGERPGPPRR